MDKFKIFFIAFLLPPLFLVVKFRLLNFLKTSLKFSEILSRRAVVLVASFLGTLIYSAFMLFFIKSGNLGFVDFISSLNPSSNFKFNFLNELYSYSFYMDEIYLWFYSSLKYKILIFLAIFINKFLFFTALCYLMSLFFSSNSYKIGYFLGTIFTLSYISLVFITINLQNSIKFRSEISSTITEKIIKVAIKNGKTIELLESEFRNLESSLESKKVKSLDSLKAELNDYIDATFDKGADEFSKKVADFRFSFISEYLMLWHGSFGDGADEFMAKKLKSFLDESFDEKISENLNQIISQNLANFEREISISFGEFGGTEAVNFESLDRNFSRFSFSFGGLSSVLIAKVGIKMAAKTSSKVAGAATGAGSVVVCGPGAVVCVPLFVVATWFGVDYIVAKGDELLNKESFEKMIRDDINSQKELFKAQIFKELDEIYSQILENYYTIKE